MDAAGNETVSANSTFTTAAVSDTTAPTVTWSGPPANSILLGTVTLTATASDNVAVGGVQFLLDGNTARHGRHDLAVQLFLEHDDGMRTARTRCKRVPATRRGIRQRRRRFPSRSTTWRRPAQSSSTATRGDENRTVTLTLSASDTQGRRDADAFLQRRHHVFCGRSLCDVEELDAHERRRNQDGLRAISRCRRQLVDGGDRHHRAGHHRAVDFGHYSRRSSPVRRSPSPGRPTNPRPRRSITAPRQATARPRRSIRRW